MPSEDDKSQLPKSKAEAAAAKEAELKAKADEKAKADAEAAAANEGLVEVRKGYETLYVHPTTVAEHEKVGWKAR